MPFAVRTLIIIAAGLCAVSATAAQGRHLRRHAYGPIVPAPPIVMPAPPSTGLNTSGVNQPGVPNTSRPGTIGTGATPSGLNGDSPTAPGFPGKVGRD
ncbi:MAG TPA: hypothetical protein VHC94_20510 [Nitrobacter sp.]|nr:hypothetical protein [Nitrobacter sp.]